MWIIIGLFGFYLIYRLEFRFYLVSMIKAGYSPAIVPMFLLNPRAHWILQGLALLIFCLSTCCFYRASPWAVLLSPVLLFLAMTVHAQKQSSRIDKVITLAVGVQTSLERQGESQERINEAVCLATLGEENGAGRGWRTGELLKGRNLSADWELKEMVKCSILPSLGLLASRSSLIMHNGMESSAYKQHEKDCREIDRKIETGLQLSRSRQNAG